MHLYICIAELQAVVFAALMELRPLEVRTDSTYVVNGVQKGQHGWKEAFYWKKGRPIANADLWRQLSDALAQREENMFKVSKVKGHATIEDVEGGAVSGADKFGNDSADSLAVTGAARACNSTGQFFSQLRCRSSCSPLPRPGKQQKQRARRRIRARMPDRETGEGSSVMYRFNS